MIQAIIDRLGSELLSYNSEWLQQVRSVGYQLRQSQEGRDTFATINDELEEIGLKDTRLNSAYIRFRSDVNFSVVPAPRISTEIGLNYSFGCRIVVLSNTKNTIDLSFLISRQINSIKFHELFGLKNISFEVTSGGANTASNHLSETGKPIINNDFRIFYVDFNLKFTDYNYCDFTNNIQTPMNCNCNNVFDGGCFASCDEIELPFIATSTQTRIETEFNGSIVRFNVETDVGEKVTIPSGNLNEDYTYLIRAYSNDTELVQLTYEPEPSGTVYDCIKITVKP